MICNNCNIKSICKIFDTLNHPGIEASLTSCAYNQVKENTDKPVVSQHIEPAKPKVVEERKSRAYQDITELSNKLKAEKEAEKMKKMKKNQPKVNILETTEEEVDCPNCNTKTTTTYNCPTCKKEMCLLCSMTSIDINGKVINLCEECWATDDEKMIEDVNVCEPAVDIKAEDEKESKSKPKTKKVKKEKL